MRVRAAPMTVAGRNDPCLCGSGKKYKKCCANEGTYTSPHRQRHTNESQLSKAASATPAEFSPLIAMINAGQFAELESRTLEMMNQYPNSAFLWKALSVSLWRQGKDALQALEKTVQLSPEDAEAHSNLGNALRARRLFDEAAASHRRALALQPSYAEAHNNLGTALRDLGQRDQAVESFHRALALKPRFAVAHCNLGEAFRSLGQFDEALTCYFRALEIQPDFIEAHSRVGDVSLDIGRLHDSLASYRRVIAFKPDLATAHYGEGNALLGLGQYGEAVSSYRRALALKPAFADAHNNLGVALRQLGRPTEAATSCRTALQIDPNLVAAIVFLAQLHADGGAFVEAEDEFRRALSIEPDSPEAWAGIAGLRKMTGSDAGWLAEAQRIAGRPLLPRQEIALRYAIGKYFDDTRDFEQAFVNYQRANELTKLHRPAHDRQGVTQAVDRIVHRYDRAWIHGARNDANSTPRPVFIVGMPRSGTTLAEQILAAHPAVFGAGELSFWNIASTTHESLPHHKAGDALISELGDAYLKILRDLSADALRVSDKMPDNFKWLGLIHAALPKARIIHLRRNPLDTCLSIYFQNFQNGHSYANDLDDLSHFYGEYLRTMTHWQLTLPEGAILEVLYEDLIDDPETWSRKMLEFVGLEWEPACLDFHLASRTITTFSKWQARQKINKSSVDRWRNYERYLGPLLSLVSRHSEFGRLV